MPCLPCTLIAALALNVLNLGDHALNTITLGDADETVSARVARARNAGREWAAESCKALTFAQTVVTLGAMSSDHCVYALDKQIKPNTAEILNWNADPWRLHRRPVNEE